MDITATYTAETLLLIVNNQSNSTRTSTIRNTEIDFAHITPPTNTNSAGTVTTSISLDDGVTITATFPTTPYEDYASTYVFSGTLPTVVSGTSTCLTIAPGTSTSDFNSNNGVFTFPSHPPLPVGVQTDGGVDLSLDPRGWTFVGVIEQTCDYELIVQPLFPDLGVWSCTGATFCDSPAEVLQTALYLTVTSTSHEAGLTTSSPPGPVASPPVSSLVPLLSSRPTPNVPSVSFSDQQSNQPAPYNPPTSAQSASISPSPGVQPGSINQPAQSKQPAPTNSPSLIKTVPNKLPYSGQEPASNNQPAPAQSTSKSPLPVQQPAPKKQPISDNQPSSNDQTTPSQAAYNSPSTNAQGSDVVYTTFAATIPVLQTSSNNPGHTSVSTDFSLLNPHAPVTLVSQVVTSTNAQGSVILTTRNTVPVPIVTTSTNPQGKAIVTTSTKLSPVALTPTASPIAFIPTSITATNAQGITTVFTDTAAIIPIIASSTDLQGQIVLSSSLLTAAATASTNIVVSLTNAQCSIKSSTTQVPAVIFTTTNAEGSQILTTLPISPITTAFTTPPRITIGTQTIIPNSQSQYMIDSQTLTPGGAITVSGTTISLAPSASALVIGTNTQQLVTGTTTLPTLTIGTLTVSPNSVSQYIISSQTLTPGGIITLSSTPISLAPSATALIIGSNTIPLGSSTTLPPPLTIGSQVFTANNATQYNIGSQTLTPGGVITVSGTRVSLAPGDTAAVVGTSTEGLGALVTAGLGTGPGNGNGNGTAKFTGGARKSGIPGLAVWLEGVLLLLGLGMVIGL